MTDRAVQTSDNISASSPSPSAGPLVDLNGSKVSAATRKLLLKEQFISEIAQHILLHKGPDDKGRAHPSAKRIRVNVLELALEQARGQGLQEDFRPYHFVGHCGTFKQEKYIDELLIRKIDYLIQGSSFGSHPLEVIKGLSTKDLFSPLRELIAGRSLAVPMDAVVNKFRRSTTAMIRRYCELRASDLLPALPVAFRETPDEFQPRGPIYQEHLNSDNSLRRFETHFQLPSSLPKDLKEKIIAWALSKLPEHHRDEAEAIAKSPGWGTWSKGGWKIELVEINDDSLGRNRDLFALRLKKPDSDYPQTRKWITEISLVTNQGKEPEFSLGLYVQDVPKSSLRPAGFSTPGIVSDFVQNLEAKSSQLPVSDQALELTQIRVKKFVDSLQDSQRELPVVYISRNAEDQVLVDPDRLAYKLRGLAIVVVEQENDGSSFTIVDALQNYLPKKFLAYGGAIRVYAPNLNPEDSQDYIRHRFLDPVTISELGPIECSRRLHALVDRQKIENPASRGETATSEIFSLLRKRQLAETEKKPDPLEPKHEITEFKAIINPGDSELEALKRELSSLESDASTWRELAESYEAQNIRLQERIAKLEGELEALKAPKLSDKIRKISGEYGDKIGIYHGAIDGVDKAFAGNARLHQHIEKMLIDAATILHSAHFGDTRVKLIKNEFESKSNYGLAPKESETTMTNTKLREERIIFFEGKHYLGEAHLKYGRTPGNQVRIHYALDRDTQRIIITHIVDHLQVTSTN